MNWLRQTLWAISRSVAIAVLAVAAASAIRILLLSSLETRIAWVTFYPAVMIAALLGGWLTGLLTTAASCLIVIHGWSLFTTQPFIQASADWLGLIAFAINCAMISAVAEANRRAQRRARQAQTQAEAANRAKSVFLANMSHELRTPLNAILGFSNLMRHDETLAEAHRRTLEIVNRSGEHLLKLINDVLDMAKIEAGHTQVLFAPFDIQMMLRDTTDLLRERAETRGLELVLEQSPGFPHSVSTDEPKIRQVITNLVGNAVKFTGQGRVTLRARMETAGQLIFEVEDTGIGIAAADQKHIFEPFVQIGAGAAQKGTGLGLAITRQYVELLQGQIEVESTPGKGSRFTVRVPVELVNTLPQNLARVTNRRVVGLAPGQVAPKILIVEDNADNALLLRQILTSVGFEVREAENGLAGVAMFQSWSPHFIWMDCRMPVLDGLEATRRIRALEDGQGDPVKIVALTASVFTDERDNILAAGMDDFMRKPFQPEEIYACMERHLHLRFVYAGEMNQVATGSTAMMDREALAGLPPALRAELFEALVSLDQNRIAEMVDRVSAQNPALGEVLSVYTGRLEYTTIFKELKALSDSSNRETP